jgi:hypothetical protein
MEQRAHNVLIRPSAEYVGPEPRRYVAIEERSSYQPQERDCICEEIEP